MIPVVYHLIGQIDFDLLAIPLSSPVLGTLLLFLTPLVLCSQPDSLDEASTSLLSQLSLLRESPWGSLLSASIRPVHPG
jgi:holin-like protein